ncbi:hypothetical protein LSH36_807g00117 [Paralvinella palmiformis]|uniref:CCHC-type domain-containing protein n=1 Tax=Paralvinella palmiformis TaxID=53620 RepID=A0AAD9J0K5_9ANNE|nr:hypothetical protein LSH36_807g00117 [Paralvinella palmiformis]
MFGGSVSFLICGYTFNDRPLDMDRRKISREYSFDLPNLYDIFLCEVANVQQYGIFVKIPGYKKNGLVHKSQMSKSKVDDPSDMVEPHDHVYCKVISIDQESEKIGMSMKVVNQTTGQDLDPGHVQTALDEQRRKTGHVKEIPRIELGAVLDTTCKKCGGRGHLAHDCFHVSGGKSYSLLPDLEYLAQQESETKHRQKKKKEKLSKKEKKAKKKAKKKKSEKQKDIRTQSGDENNPKHHKKGHKRKISESSDSGSDTSEDKSALKRSRHEQVDKRSDKRKYPELDHRKSNKYTEQQTKVTEHGTRRDHATGSDRYKTKHSTEHGNFDRSEGHRPSKGDDIHGDGRAEDRHADKDESRRHSHHRSRTQER